MAQRRGRFDGKTLAELRAWAGELAEQGYPIPHASRLRGVDLLRECYRRESLKVVAAEQRFREALGSAPIIGKRARELCGCLIEITGDIEHSIFPMPSWYIPLIVPGIHVESCRACADLYGTAEHRNQMSSGIGRKFQLCSLTLVPRPVNPATAEAKIAQATTPTATEAATDAAFGDAR